LTDDLFRVIRGTWGGCLVTMILLLGPAFLMPAPFDSGNAGVLPFLISPFVCVLFVPYFCRQCTSDARTTILMVGWFSLVIGLVFVVGYALFGSPRPLAALKGTMVIYSLSVLVSGLYVLTHRLYGSTSLSQWGSTIAGLLLTGSFVYLSPVADLLYADRGTRNLVIAFATELNPVLALSGGILQQDLLRGAFLYEHLSIGRYYAYNAPSWIRIVLSYIVLGCAMYGICRWINVNHQEQAPGETNTEIRNG
jgi:hypothetical protein